MRQLTVAGEFSRDGYAVKIFGFDNYENYYGDLINCKNIDEAVKDADIVILPLPWSMDGTWLNCPLTKKEIKIDELISRMSEEQILVAGKLSEKIKEKASEKGIKCFDYYEREELIIQNAIPTAEGAIAIAMQEIPTTLHSSECCVIGFGRVGKILAKDLKALGAKVTVFARKFETFAWIKAYDTEYRCINDLADTINQYDVIYNTAPTKILGEDKLKNVKKGAVIIDLASSPGGVDMDYARNHGINVVWALSLPGKVAPVTAGQIIKESIENMLFDNGVIV